MRKIDRGQREKGEKEMIQIRKMVREIKLRNGMKTMGRKNTLN